jgi:hypothetical protein
MNYIIFYYGKKGGVKEGEESEIERMEDRKLREKETGGERIKNIMERDTTK